MAKEKLLRQYGTGFYNYQFNWVNECGISNGFNDVWAPNKREAVKLAKAMESKAHWSAYDQRIGKYVEVKESDVKDTMGNFDYNPAVYSHVFYNKGMYVDVKSMYKATAKQAAAMDRLGWMMTV